jgi:molybdenum cofactor synthesis domain-containing protein
MEYRLLEKTELWISPLRLTGADLEACALAAARVLDLSPEEIMVTDAIGDRLTLDILVPTIRPDQIVGRKEADDETGEKVVRRSRAMGEQISEHIRRRAMVFATGQEVLAGQIRDTNTPFLIEALDAEGYEATRGPVLDDRAQTIARAFRQAAEDGYGLLISTGGIGAEGKDQTLEALTKLDRHASMPYILKFQKGEGRHHKDGVRIGVGILEQTLIICLPGPHDEVRLVWPVLKEGMQERWDKETLAEGLANALRNKFLARSADHRDPSDQNHPGLKHGFK